MRPVSKTTPRQFGGHFCRKRGLRQAECGTSGTSTIIFSGRDFGALSRSWGILWGDHFSFQQEAMEKQRRKNAHIHWSMTRKVNKYTKCKKANKQNGTINEPTTNSWVINQGPPNQPNQPNQPRGARNPPPLPPYLARWKPNCRTYPWKLLQAVESKLTP